MVEAWEDEKPLCNAQWPLIAVKGGQEACCWQVRKTAEAALEAIDSGMCVVIGLQSTGEANATATREEQGDVLDDFVSGDSLSPL